MKRHKSIVVLSRDHHSGLLFCWKIRQGLSKQIPTERMQPYVQYFWDNHLRKHFEEEETLLFGVLQDPFCQQAISEHIAIRNMVSAMSGTDPVSQLDLASLADALDNHIRFEERILFPHLEKTLSAQVLADIGVHLSKSHKSEQKDNYPDAFWV